MATPIINNLVLPGNRVLVLLDVGSETTGTISQVSSRGGGQFVGSFNPEAGSAHILFAKEMGSPVEIDDVEYVAMHVNAVVGVIPT